MKKWTSLFIAGMILGGTLIQTSAFAESKVGDKGSRDVQVTYNGNAVDPDPGTDPDFLVLIPKSYTLKDDTGIDKGEVKLTSKDDISEAYTGKAIVSVKATSKNNWKFLDKSASETGAEYKLVDNANAAATEFNLDKTTSNKAVNASLTKKGAKSNNNPGFDTLTFAYEVTAIAE
ncbi:hypothetical protein LWX64_002603 [Enterococcus faecalis]|nr:hypothetical protein [Enterococcus faecalis]